MKKSKQLLSLLLIGTLALSTNISAAAASTTLTAAPSISASFKAKVSASPSNGAIRNAYEAVIDYATANGIPLDLSLETFIEEYEASSLTLATYEQSYYDLLPKQNPFTTYASGEDTWYYDTGTDLPQPANYSKYNLLDTVVEGDVIYESKGGWGITGHTAIVEGTYYSSTYQQYYIRIIEATTTGVVRSVLDDDRIDDKGSSILRVDSATPTIALNAISFCLSQLGKDYMIDFQKDTGIGEPDWYCSELVWAGYYRQGIDIETDNFFNEPGITPRDINNCDRLTSINFR
ncbi:MAG: hypothetical protein LBV33_01305 [Lachnospiraceae bacterium]|jgi:hypothetical protein|nr:hypothetical protein [Lachnospiraceae bacterium]